MNAARLTARKLDLARQNKLPDDAVIHKQAIRVYHERFEKGGIEQQKRVRGWQAQRRKRPS